MKTMIGPHLAGEEPRPLDLLIADPRVDHLRITKRPLITGRGPMTELQVTATTYTRNVHTAKRVYDNETAQAMMLRLTQSAAHAIHAEIDRTEPAAD